MMNEHDRKEVMNLIKLKKMVSKNMNKEQVNHPSHYAEGRKYEPIDVIQDWKLDFCLGNAVKYISRVGRKVNSIEDLEKARFYLDYKIKELQGGDI